MSTGLCLGRFLYRVLLAQTKGWPPHGLVPRAQVDVSWPSSLRPFDYLPLGSGTRLISQRQTDQSRTVLITGHIKRHLLCAELDTPPLRTLVPDGLVHLPQTTADGHITTEAMRSCVRANFKQHMDVGGDQQGSLLDQARCPLSIDRHAVCPVLYAPGDVTNKMRSGPAGPEWLASHHSAAPTGALQQRHGHRWRARVGNLGIRRGKRVASLAKLCKRC